MINERGRRRVLIVAGAKKGGLSPPIMQLEDESFVGRDRGKSAADEGEIEISKEL